MSKKIAKKTENSNKTPELGNFLLVLVILTAISSIYSISTLLSGEAQRLSEAVLGEKLPFYYHALSFIGNALALGASYSLWKFKKWGVYMLIASYIISGIVTMYMFPTVSLGAHVAITLAFGALWYFAIKPKWEYFTDK